MMIMCIPAKCPLDGRSNCKGKQCHLYHVDWRTKEANCIIGYGSSHKTTRSERVILDTYIENTRIKLGRDIGIPEMPEKGSESDLQNIVSDVKTSGYIEKIAESNRNTTVIEIHEKVKKERGKIK